ncbi:MAG: adenosine deaminase [Oscillospiraceae bacterium]|nr:adenosine deaminase [Oscillospiraceae bacterium]
MNPYALIDLHLHLDGSLSLASVRELAAMQNIDVDADDKILLKRLQVNPGCRNLNEYLEKFDFPCSLLQTSEALTRAVSNLRRELAQQGLLYAEIRFAPQFHLAQGLTQDQVVEAAVAGLAGEGVKANLILCCMRVPNSHEKNLETVRMAAKYLGKGVCAADLAGAEALFPAADFAEEFALARELGVPFTLHAGEAAGPESIRQALALGAKRIGHGVRCIEDEALMAELAEKGIPLEMCPTSNVQTCIFEKVSDYPLVRLLDAGIRSTVNTDNMMVSGVTLSSEMDHMAALLTPDQMRQVVNNSVEAVFADEETKNWLRNAVAERL